jgi:glycosyltransferase involved in cell wall biosynthesis
VRVHQLTFGMIPGDAISNHVVEIDRRLRSWGLQTATYAQHIAPEMAGCARPDYEYVTHLHAPDDLLIYHYGLYSPSVRYFQASRGRRILVYHNITPACYFRGWSRGQELLCDVGRRTLPSLLDCDLALGDSDFNRQELVDLGFDPGRSGVLPVFFSQQAFETVPANRTLLEQLQEHGGANFLSVGRIVPNKAVEDVIRIFAVYRRAIDPQAHLYLVGSRYLAAYDEALDALVEALHLQDSVVFAGLVSLSDLKTYYQAADLYLHASYHEGFCVPLLESMYFGVPILARKAAAVPETLGEAGVLFTRLGHREVAEIAHLLVDDQSLRAQVIARQRERLQDFGPLRVEARLREILARIDILPPSDVEAGD